MKISGMALNVPKTNCNGSRLLALACALLVALAAAALHAQIITYTDVYDFSSSDGHQPFDYGQLQLSGNGYLYGTAYDGGSSGYGTVFNVSGSLHNDLVSFNNSGGIFPIGALTMVVDFSEGFANESFYGTTSEEVNFGNGTLFCVTPEGVLTVVHQFTDSEGSPVSPPVQGADGNLYGITSQGLNASFTTYRYTISSGTYKMLPSSVPGASTGPMVLGVDGYLYGVAGDAIFRMTTPGGAIKIIYNFSGPDGASPSGPLVEGPDNSFYGVARYGGANNTGTIYKLSPSGGGFTYSPMYSFTGLSGLTNSDGAEPIAGLAFGWDGKLYGATTSGGAFGYGTIYQIPTSGGFKKLFDLSGAGGAAPGNYPTTTMMENADSCLYGLTTGGVSIGETTGYGNVYKLCPESLIQIVTWCCNAYHNTGDPLMILGDNLEAVVTVSIGGVPAQFQPGSNTYLTAIVPSNAVDGLVSVILATGEQVESESTLHILPTITNLDPPSGPVGTQVGIVGGGFAGATEVTFGGVKATNFTVVTPSLIQAVVPARAKTGKVKVTTPNGTATSKQTFTVN
jgi:uncharacterized repeat protein (TIGR03803 family)